MMRFRITEQDGSAWEIGAKDEFAVQELLTERNIAVQEIVRIDSFPHEVIYPRGGHADGQIIEPVTLTTTHGIESRAIVRYCGIVTGEAILGANIFKDLFAEIRDIVGGRSATYEKELQRARDIALRELQQRAFRLGANAVVGVDLDYEVLGPHNGMLMVSASGTAVVVE